MTQGRKPGPVLTKLRAMQAGEIITLHCPRDVLPAVHYARVGHAAKYLGGGFQREHGADGAVIVARVA